jgi:hypothetical protein
VSNSNTTDAGESDITDAPASATEPAASMSGSGIDPVPETGDLVIDAALADLAAAGSRDLDAQIAAGEQVQRTLQSRLADLGG